jgi:ferredoxin--NADP+ reductase
MRAIAESPLKDAERSLSFHFQYQPIEIQGDRRVESVLFATPGGRVEIPCDLVVTAIGYEPIGILGLEQDGNRYKNSDGHIEGNLYVVGWAKRGPTGVIGTNKSDATDVMNRLVNSLQLPKAKQDLVPVLKERGVRVIQQDAWRRINESEINAGTAAGRPRVKITDINEMIEVGHGEDKILSEK